MHYRNNVGITDSNVRQKYNISQILTTMDNNE